MRAAMMLTAAVAVSAACPAAAQLRNRSIAVESGLSTPLAGAGGALAGLALAASAWLEGPAEVTARVAFAAAPQTGGRGAAAAVEGAVGVRVSLLPDPLRPQLGIELGWARVRGPAGPEDRVAFGVSAGLEWFLARDVAVAPRASLRATGAELSLDLMLGLAAYF